MVFRWKMLLAYMCWKHLHSCSTGLIAAIIFQWTGPHAPGSTALASISLLLLHLPKAMYKRRPVAQEGDTRPSTQPFKVLSRQNHNTGVSLQSVLGMKVLGAPVGLDSARRS